MPILPLTLFFIQTQATPMETLAERHNQALAVADPKQKQAEISQIQSEIQALVTQNKLKTARDFALAGSLLYSPTNFFEIARVKYELILTAAKMGDLSARSSLALVWDSLLLSIGRNPRLAVNQPQIPNEPESHRPRYAPKAVLKFFENPIQFIEAAKVEKDSEKVRELVDADQEDRQADWSKFNQKDIEALVKRDADRLKQIKEITDQGHLATATDYFNAALVCQHGSGFEDYAFAHELSIIAMILNHPTAPWLAAASYDRMLLNMGHRQRFGTQWSIIAGVQQLSPLDEILMNETTRKTIGQKTLVEIRKRAEQYLKESGG